MLLPEVVVSNFEFRTSDVGIDFKLYTNRPRCIPQKLSRAVSLASLPWTRKPEKGLVPHAFSRTPGNAGTRSRASTAWNGIRHMERQQRHDHTVMRGVDSDEASSSPSSSLSCDPSDGTATWPGGGMKQSVQTTPSRLMTVEK